MKSPEQLADAIKRITDLCNECEMPAIFVGTVKANDNVNIITYPGYHVSPDSEQDLEQIARQLYQAAIETPKSHLGTIILNVAAAMCVESKEINALFMQDLGKKQAQKYYDKIRREVFKDQIDEPAQQP